MKRIFTQFAILLGFTAAQLLHASIASEKSLSPSLTLASPTLEIDFPVRESLIQFFYVPQRDEEPNIEIYLSYRSGVCVRTAHLETIEPEGRAAEISSVFTLDADGDKEGDLFIIATWPINHAAIGTEGTYYKIYAYRKSAVEGNELEFHRARDIEDKLGSGLDGTREGVEVSFPFKEYASIRAALAR
ncbi:hypothetical protein H0E84_14985 [Luteimonas sp. SJ-92]|uniref:Uncharacterized protein n=1 Tax=Luteimonas salinisoli TaxID=2752307 RepID=A0A853JG06_9GAMM|nr:hypothetical protein [Luteimonas salinisoli]NZA27684.1 hypothetical protein [Luteimonas salinisoli]